LKVFSTGLVPDFWESWFKTFLILREGGQDWVDHHLCLRANVDASKSQEGVLEAHQAQSDGGACGRDRIWQDHPAAPIFAGGQRPTGKGQEGEGMATA